MMKKYLIGLVFSLSLLSSSLNYAQSASQYLKRSEKHERLLAAYISSVVLSSALGAATGTISRYMEKKLNIEAYPCALFLMLLSWALESEFRNDIIIALQKDLDKYGFAYKSGLMFKGAWIASWLSYLHAQNG
jgi:hypothetical protein